MKQLCGQADPCTAFISCSCGLSARPSCCSSDREDLAENVLADLAHLGTEASPLPDTSTKSGTREASAQTTGDPGEINVDTGEVAAGCGEVTVGLGEATAGPEEMTVDGGEATADSVKVCAMAALEEEALCAALNEMSCCRDRTS